MVLNAGMQQCRIRSERARSQQRIQCIVYRRLGGLERRGPRDLFDTLVECKGRVHCAVPKDLFDSWGAFLPNGPCFVTASVFWCDFISRGWECDSLMPEAISYRMVYVS